MDEDVRRVLELVALQLAVIVVAAHLWWGLPRFVDQLRFGVLIDPRPPLFVLSSMAILAGTIYVAVGGRRVPVYALGIALMAAYFFGYWGWHLVGHVSALPWVEGSPGHSDLGVFETLYVHLRDDAHALISKTAEVALAAVLSALLYDENARGDER